MTKSCQYCETTNICNIYQPVVQIPISYICMDLVSPLDTEPDAVTFLNDTHHGSATASGRQSRPNDAINLSSEAAERLLDSSDEGVTPPPGRLMSLGLVGVEFHHLVSQRPNAI